MKLSKLAALALGVASLAGSNAAHAEWLEAKSKHFTVYADMPDNALRERTQRLERFDAALRGLFNVKTDDLATIYIVESLSEVQRLAGNSRVAGFYRADAQGALGFVPEKMPNQRPGMSAERILYHEYTHHMLLSNTSQFFPGWVTEGLAELFMTAKFDESGSVIIGAPNESRTWAMTSMNRWTVRRLLESDANPPKGDERIELYSRGWLMCHYLLISGKRPGQFFKFIDLLNTGVAPLQAGQQVFGDLDALDAELERYLRGTTFPTSLLNADRIKASTDVATRALTVGENAILPYRMSSANGVNDKTAGPLADRARPVAARYPSEPFVQRAMAEMEYDVANATRKDGQFDVAALARAEAAADRTLALDPNNVMGLVYKGRVAALRAVQSKDINQWRNARRLFLRANQLSPDYALPFQLFYDTFVAAGQLPTEGAVTGMRRAVVLVPADTSLRVRMGIEMIRLGELGLARTVLAPVAFNPHASEKNPYAKLVKLMDEGANKDALMARAVELKLDRINEFDPPKLDEDGKDEDAKPDAGKPAEPKPAAPKAS